MDTVINFLSANKGVILGGLFGLSELLALIPGVKANSVFQAIFGFFKKESGN